jgi:stringent starvation protein B
MTGRSDKPTGKRPYLLRAMHEWMLDNDMTPHIVVDATRKDLQVPGGHATDGKLVLNVSPTATRGLHIGNDRVTFETRFGGVSRRLEIPVDAVLGIYARENGQGMIFPDEDTPPGPEGPDKPPGGEGPEAPKKPALKVVK